MARDLFGDVTRPFNGVGARSRLTVPLSIAAHTAAVVAIVVVPLLATDALPALREGISYTTITPVVPPEPPRPRVARPPDAPRVVWFLHGILGQGRNWRSFARRLVDAVQAVGQSRARPVGGAMVDDDERPAGLERREQRRARLFASPCGKGLEIEVVEILHCDDRIERFAESRRRERAGDGVDIGIGGIDRGLIGAILFLERDELGGLKGMDPACRTDRGGEQPGDIAAAHNEIADPLARRDLRERHQFGGFARRVTLAVGGGARRISERGGIVGYRGLVGSEGGRRHGEQQGEGKRTDHEIDSRGVSRRYISLALALPVYLHIRFLMIGFFVKLKNQESRDV